MAVAFVRQHQSGTSGSPGPGLALAIDSLVQSVAGNTLIAWVSFDNISATTPTVTSISVPAGETASWVQIAAHDSSTSSPSSGCRGEVWAIKTTVAWPVSTTVQVSLSSSVTAKAGSLAEFSGVSTTVRGSAGAGTSTTSVPSASTTTGPSAGDLTVGLASFEFGSSGSVTGDSDTTNGSWSTAVAVQVGSTSSGMTCCAQYKIATATGAQTYNPTFNFSTDSGAAVVALQAAASTTNLTVSATCTTSVTTARSVAKAIATTATTTVATVRQVAHRLSATVTTSPTVQRTVGKVLRATATTSVGVAFGRAYLVVVSATVNTAVSLRRSVQRIVATTVTTSTSVQRLISRRIGATVTTGVSVSAVYQKLRRAAYRVWTSSTGRITSRTRQDSALNTRTSSNTGLGT